MSESWRIIIGETVGLFAKMFLAAFLVELWNRIEENMPLIVDTFLKILSGISKLLFGEAESILLPQKQHAF